MKKSTVYKLAGSSALLALSAVGCSPNGSMRPFALSSKAPKQSDAAKSAQAAVMALASRNPAAAVAPAEHAVELAPNDIGYRATLAQAYLGVGRFTSAEAAYGDILSLAPNDGKAILGLGLAQIAQGQRADASATLQRGTGIVAPADLGLALALAGEPQRAIDVLEPAVRSPRATAKARQNLALAYALAGRWDKAKATASVDVPADQIAARMEEWAALASPDQASTRVASLLGATPAADPGLPERLALNSAAPVATAAAAPEVTVPVQTAEAAPAPASAPVVAEAAPAPVVAEAAAPVAPKPVAVAAVRPAKVRKPAAAPAAPVLRRAAAPLRRDPAPTQLTRAVFAQAKGGRFAVQLGAFRTAQRVEAAWDATSAKFTRLASYTPSRGTFGRTGHTLHRLSIAGISNREDAVKLCAMIRDGGGSCFVRETAGDAPMQFARRKTDEKLAARKVDDKLAARKVTVQLADASPLKRATGRP